MAVKFVHIHIPKTAGTSVTSCMRSMFGNNKVAHFGRWQRVALFRSLTREQLSDYRCIGGHVRYEEFLKKVGPRPLYFTILREPVDRYISFYSDVYYRDSHLLHDVARSLSPVDFLHESISKNYILSQTLYVSRDNSLVSAQKLIREGKIIAASLENHDQLLAFIASKAGKNVKILPRKNKSKRDLPVDIAVIRPLIQEVFQDDFKLFDFVNSDKNYLFS